MSFQDSKAASNDPALVHALTGEKIVGTLFDFDGRMWLIVESGHAFVISVSVVVEEGEKPSLTYYRKTPGDVQSLIKKRLDQLATWQREETRLMNISMPDLEKQLGAAPTV